MKLHSFLSGMTLSVALFLSACGGGNDSGGSGGVTPFVPMVQAVKFIDRGALISATQTHSVNTIEIDAATSANKIQSLTGAAACGVDSYQIEYVTLDPAGEPASASAGVMLPTGGGANCSGSRPVLLYAHGTSFVKSYDMSDIVNNSEASLIMAFYAAQGYIVVAPDYLGYMHSGMDYTPYLNAEASSIDVVDGLRAAKTEIEKVGRVKPSGKLFITGYSQGGHVAMAAQEIIQRDYANEFAVTASGPMSGPYNLSAFADEAITKYGTRIELGTTLFFPMLMTSYERAYGNMYSSLVDVYQSPFYLYADNLLPTDTPLADLVAAGRLPANDPGFSMLFGTGGLLTDYFHQTYFESNFRKALQTNTLLDWTPAKPITLCGGANDPVVFFDNTTTAANALNARGGAAVKFYDLEDISSVGPEIYNAFQATVVAHGAQSTKLYHPELVPPFCNALERAFFQKMLDENGQASSSL